MTLVCYQYLRLVGGVASTALVIPMNKGIQGVGGSVEAEMMKTLMKKQQLSWLFG